jgi:hypothetical protein
LLLTERQFDLGQATMSAMLAAAGLPAPPGDRKGKIAGKRVTESRIGT